MQKLIKLEDFTPEEFRKWQLKLLDILVYFLNFCEEHKLRFYLSFGTCLGAVRHHGFIPWDDDVDVCMPRDDYDKLYDLWDKYADKSKFLCCQTDARQSVGFPMILIRSVDTTCIYPHSKDKDICHGLKIDVEPLDGSPKSKFKVKLQTVYAAIYALFMTQRAPNQTSKTKKIIAKIFLLLFQGHKFRYKIAKLFEKRVKQYKFTDCDNVRILAMKPVPRRWFDKVEYVDFEGYRMPIPADYDEYLRNEYGDYMTFPPLEERTRILSKVVFYDLDNGYEKYKGKYYCVKRN